MKINRNLVFSLIIHVLTFIVFYLAGIASWEFLERFTNHIRHGKLAEGLASHFGMQVFFVLELILAFVPHHKIKVSLILIYAAYAFWQWFPPSYTPYRFLYHAVFGTVLMICAEIVSCRLTRKHTEEKKGDETMEASRDVVLYKMPESRPCDYCFSLLDGSVFVDFEIKESLAYLVRISFDGYGCYCVQGTSNPLCRKNTELLEKIVRGGIKDSDKGSLLALIKNAIKINRPLLRADEPLKEYALIGENDFIRAEGSIPRRSASK